VCGARIRFLDGANLEWADCPNEPLFGIIDCVKGGSIGCGCAGSVRER
jgi:hypothetical protein